MSAVLSTDPLYRTRWAAMTAWTTNAEAARPGQVWTYRYSTAHAVTGGPFTSYTAGPVRILGEECPVPAYRGMRCLGEADLDDTTQTVGYGQTGRVKLTTLTKEFFVPGFLERDEGEREEPCEQYPWDGISGVRPFRALAESTTVGVY